MQLYPRNDVLSHNFPVASNNITERGSNWLWAVMALMLVSMLAFVVLTAMSRRRSLHLHYICITITLVSTFSYFVMASNLGADAVNITYLRGGKRPGPTREVFYARWIEYFITFPLEVLALLILARAAFSTKLFVIGASMFLIVCHLCGAFVTSKYKWGFLVFGVLGYLLVAWRMLTAGRRSASGIHDHGHVDGHNGHDMHANGTGTTNHNNNNSSKYTMLTAYLLLLWLLYPICWSLSEAGNVLSLDSECIFYGILDILTKPVFCALLLFMTKGLYGHHGAKTHSDVAEPVNRPVV